MMIVKNPQNLWPFPVALVAHSDMLLAGLTTLSQPVTLVKGPSGGPTGEGQRKPSDHGSLGSVVGAKRGTRVSRPCRPAAQDMTHVVAPESRFFGPSICSCPVVRARMAAARRLATTEVALKMSWPWPTSPPV